MPLDWNRIGSTGQQLLVQPRDIFAALPNKPFSYLRQEQGEVLEGWFARKDDRDVVIKQNTGGGKTVVGLLIAQSTLNEGIGKAVYLAPDTYLAARVREEAARLGLPTAERHDAPSFLAGRAILITTFHKLINGQSVFGIAGGQRTPLDLGVVVVDDAHAALATTEGQFRLTIPIGHEAFYPLFDLFADDLKEQNRKATFDITEGDVTAAVRVPFWAWANKFDEVWKILYPFGAARDEAFKFAWPLIADCLQLCTVMVSSRGIEIQPPCPPIDKIPSFVGARRRVYLTATLSDDSVLVTNLKADPKNLEHVVTPGSAADLGDRLVLAPVQLNPNLSDDAVRTLAKQFSLGDRDGDGNPETRPVNVVVLVPSSAQANLWRGLADRIHYVGDLEAGVAELRARHVGLVVLVNKYDGIDLPGTACEMLVIDGIPRPMSAADRREAAALIDSPTRRARDAQRIEQGMGRGVRDVGDRCAVLLLGAGLAMAVHDNAWLELFSPATHAQLELSRDVALQLYGQGLDGIRSALSVCLDRDPQWVQRSRFALASVRYRNAGAVRPEAAAARDAFDLAVAGQTSQAADRLQTAINGLTDPALRGWVREQKAGYLHFTDPNLAQQQLGAAIRDNPGVLRPTVAVNVRLTRPAAVQARTAAGYLGATYADSTALVLGVRTVLDEIVWDEERTDQAEAAWEKLGLHLGFGSTRPERLYNTGPDNLWTLTPTSNAVIELKTGVELTCTGIAKKDADQLRGAVQWNTDAYGAVAAVPVMVHPVDVYDARAIAVPQMRVITPAKLEEFKTAVVAFTTALTQGQNLWGEEQAVATQLAYQKLTGDRIIGTYSVAARGPGRG
ncbi:DEAD/DEAH box helicase [Amycolatopsis sp. 195334CR]|uniref:DEAD/DEAH box helicase n=1 Tax=Amycolatopsis sp. 195334CR TaxID=2814588 RepID=UPI001A9014F2|nr:DEAD/DEAH box helicase [Amycolatopsis sp. 195334CR]MBN6040040.1 DEAD/DEAH box helicase family protein [Amycolatopsis sp. 195334CR]